MLPSCWTGRSSLVPRKSSSRSMTTAGIAALEATLPKSTRREAFSKACEVNLMSLRRPSPNSLAGVEVFEWITTSVYALALDSIETQHMEPAEAARRAAREVATGFYQPRKFNGYAYRIPVDYDAGVIAQALSKYTADHIDYSKVDKPVKSARATVGAHQIGGSLQRLLDHKGRRARALSENARRGAGDDQRKADHRPVAGLAPAGPGAAGTLPLML